MNPAGTSTEKTLYDPPKKIRVMFNDGRPHVEFLATSVEVSETELRFRNEELSFHGRRQFRRSHIAGWEELKDG